MKVLFENIVREEIDSFRKEFRMEIRNSMKEYFASLMELEKGPVLQVHAAVTRNGLTKAVRKTKRSQLADMKRNESVFFEAPRGVTVERWHSRWNSTRQQMQKITGFKWSLSNDRDQGGLWITRTR
jgi:hypothetical protein